MSVVYISEVDCVCVVLVVILVGDYLIWVDMVFVVKYGFGEVGFDLWDVWSQMVLNYDV